MIAVSIKTHKNPSFIEKSSKRLRNLWKNFEYRNFMLACMAPTFLTSELVGKRNSENWKKPLYRKSMSELLSQTMLRTNGSEKFNVAMLPIRKKNGARTGKLNRNINKIRARHRIEFLQSKNLIVNEANWNIDFNSRACPHFSTVINLYPDLLEEFKIVRNI